MACNFTNLVSFILYVVVVGLTLTECAHDSIIGVCYGTRGHNLPEPEEVVSLFKDHHIRKMRLYEPNHSVFEALRHSDIEVLVGVNNKDIKKLAISQHDAKEWITTYIEAYWPSVHFRYIAVGDEAVPGISGPFVIDAMQNLYYALKQVGLEKYIKVSTVVGTSVMGVSYPPSAGEFSRDTTRLMDPIARFLAKHDAPLLANIHPYFSYMILPQRMPLSYALFLSKKVLQDGHYSYQNLFDEMLDGVYAALEKIGVSRLPIIVSESGWPTGNVSSANVNIAQLYNSNLIHHVSSSKGTPRRRERIETYLYSMFHENLRKGANNKRYWGLFYPNKTSVYPLKFES